MTTTLGKYELVRKLAVGGMAEVFLAQTAGPMGFSKTLVVKRILPHLSENQDFVTMFLNEARLAALLDHANVVQIFDLGHEGGSYYLAMELIDGPNLRDLNKGALAAGERLPLGVAVKIISLACEGLAYAHEYIDANGVPLRLVHRDISPHNILLSRSGNVKVADFGIAKAASIPSITRTGQIKGKLKYMSPEQLRDEPLDRRSDVWAMGVTLYEVITGKRPFAAPNDAGVIAGIINRQPPPLAQLGVESAELLQPIIDRALAKDRDDRYPDARALQTDLEKVLILRGAVVRGLEVAQAVARFAPPAPPPSASLPKLPAAPEREFATQRESDAAPEEVASRTDATPPESNPILASPDVGPVLTNMGAPDAGPVLTNMGRPSETTPIDPLKAVNTDPDPIERRSTDSLPIDKLRNGKTGLVAPSTTPDASPGLWSMVQRHPVAAGLLVGLALVVALFFAMFMEFRELSMSKAESDSMRGPLLRTPSLIDPNLARAASAAAEMPVMTVANRPVISTVPEVKEGRDEIDEPGGGLVAAAKAAEAAKAKGGKGAPPPPPKRHVGAQIISYGYVELNLVQPCLIAIDRTAYGTTPVSVPLEPGAHSVQVNCPSVQHFEHFQVHVTAGLRQVCKMDLSRGGNVESSLVSRRLD